MLTRLLLFLFRLLSTILGKKKVEFIQAKVAESLVPISKAETKHGEIRFYGFGEMPVFRAQTLLTKEPETIAWIDKFGSDEVLWDIGANVGVYSLYAAKKGCQVVSMEPSSINYSLLVKNIQLNDLDDSAVAMCIAVDERTKGNILNMRENSPGVALSSFGEPVGEGGETFSPGRKEFVMGFRLDDLQGEELQFPNHIKIDVDGNEARIIKGGAKLLADSRIKTVLIELDISRQDYCLGVANDLKKAGLICKELEVPDSFPWADSLRTKNFIFYRNLGENNTKGTIH